jgi:hypothetical protein
MLCCGNFSFPPLIDLTYLLLGTTIAAEAIAETEVAALET